MERSNWIDRARGIGIILVVFGHVLRGLANAGMVPANSPLWLLDYAIYSFHMPLFFVLSGLFVEKSLQKGSEGFWRSKFATVVYPYFLWSVIQGLLLVGFAGVTNSNASPWLRLSSILWSPLAPYWFLYSLFFCHLLFWLLKDIDRRALLGLALLAYVAGEFYRGGIHDISPFPDTTRGFLFYVLGVLATERNWFSRAARPSFLPIASAVFAASVTAGLTFAVPYEILLPAAFAGIALVAGLCQFGFPLAGFVAMLGRYSMPIFVMHIMAASGLRIALARLTPTLDPLLHLVFGVGAGLILPLIAYRVAMLLRIERLLGLPVEQRRPDRAVQPASGSG